MVTLFLTGKKGLETLTKLDPSFVKDVSKVYIGTDKHVKNDYSDSIKSFCQNKNIQFEINPTVKSFETKYAISIGWQKLLNFSEFQSLIVFHDSILPRLRGFNPLVTALINGDKELGVTALFASHDYDRGDIIAVEKINIKYPIKIEQAIDLVSECYAKLGNKILKKLCQNVSISAKKQDDAMATYSLWRNEDDYLIDWNDDAQKISRKVDATGFPYNGAKTKINQELITLVETFPMDDVVIENRIPGKIIFKEQKCPVVVCGKGLIKIIHAIDKNGKTLDFTNKFRIQFT